jgi:hypothetical protein
VSNMVKKVSDMDGRTLKERQIRFFDVYVKRIALNEGYNSKSL